MSATELSLLGRLPAELHTTLVERLSTQAQDAFAYELTEVVYTRASAALSDDNMLRIRSMRSAQSTKPEWSIVVLQKPEPARLSPHILQRGCTECVIQDGCHPASLASALGFSQHAFTLLQRGLRFQQGAVTIDLFQLYEPTDKDAAIDPSAYTVSVGTRLLAQPRSASGQPATTSTQELKATASAAVHQVSAQLKGIVDLGRVE